MTITKFTFHSVIRNNIIALTLLFSTPLACYAQVVEKGTHHLAIGYEAPGYLDAYVSSFIPLTNTGPFVFTYQYALRDRLAVGVQLAYVQGTTPTLALVQPGGTTTYRATYGGLAAMVRGDYHYLSGRKADLYSGLSAGLGFGTATLHESGKTDRSASLDLFVFRITAAGFRYMFSPHLGAYAEAGTFLLNPVGTIGLSVKLGTPHERPVHKPANTSTSSNDAKKS